LQLNNVLFLFFVVLFFVLELQFRYQRVQLKNSEHCCGSFD